MKNLVLFIGFLQFLNLTVSVILKPKDDQVVVFFKEGSSFQVACEIINKTESDTVIASWDKDDKRLNNETGKIEIHTKSTSTSVIVNNAKDEDAGNYTCVVSVNGQVQNRTILASSEIKVFMQDNLNVVEGNPLKLTCEISGVPAPNITWLLDNDTISNETGKVTIKNDVQNSRNVVLVIENVNMTDRGNYTCLAHSDISNKTVQDHTFVRIKDRYAALWPFLGICLEVFVLCAIILIYEKKRNKTELEESDTDQSPDQKNTPDHGKESNLRHRQ